MVSAQIRLFLGYTDWYELSVVYDKCIAHVILV